MGELRSAAGSADRGMAGPEPSATEAYDTLGGPEEDLGGPIEPEVESAPAAGGEGGDVEGARLIALNMALNGQSREETDRYLAENFDLSTTATRLLDDVYSRVG